MSACLSVRTADNRRYDVAHPEFAADLLKYEHGFYYFKGGKLHCVWNVMHQAELERRVKDYEPSDGPIFIAYTHQSADNASADDVRENDSDDHIMVTAAEVELAATRDTV